MQFKLALILAAVICFANAAIRFPLVLEHHKNIKTQNEASFESSMATLGEDSLDVKLDVLENDKKRTFTLSVDTMGDSVWIVGEGCTSRYCRGKNRLTPSTTGKKVSASHDQVTGVQTPEELIVGTEPYPINILVATDVSSDLSRKLSSGADGVLGLFSDELRYALAPNGVISFVATGKDAGFYIGLPPKMAKYATGKKHPPYMRSKSKSQWKIDINYISNDMGSWETWCNLGCPAVIDSIFNGISGPSKEIAAINKFIGADEEGKVNCDDIDYLSPIAFHIEGRSYEIDPKNYIVKSDEGFFPECLSVFVREDSYNDQWRLGLPLFKQFTTVFDINDKKIALVRS